MMVVVGNWGHGNIWCIPNGTFRSNSYFCEAAVPGGGVLIDAGLDGPGIDSELSKHGFYPNAIFCTHGHFDHIGSTAYFQKKYGCQVFLHREDTRTLKSSNFFLMAFKIPQKIELPEVTYITDEFTTEIKNEPLRYLFTPGHTPGSCVIEFGNAWFTGDTLYSHGVGLSNLATENPDLLRKSILSLWDRMTNQRFIYPGHGQSDNAASIRKNNTHLLKFIGIL